MKSVNEKKQPVAMPLLALRGLAVFPDMTLHFDVGRKKSVDALDEAMKGDRLVLLVAQRDMRDDEPEPDDLFEMGTVVRVRQIVHLPGENLRVLIDGVYRGRSVKMLRTEPYFEALVDECPPAGRPVQELRARALIRKAQEQINRYTAVGPKLPPDVFTEIMSAHDVGALADYIGSNIVMDFEDKQALLEELNPAKRMALVLDMLESEIGILSLEQEIGEKVHEEMDKGQRDYYLREQIKVISQELGESDSPRSEAEEYHNKIDALHLGEGSRFEGEKFKERREAELESARKMHEQADRLMRMPFGSHEATVVRTWLDTCLALPWNKLSKDKLDIVNARKILDHDHYGLDKVKDRIIEYIAVKKLTPEVTGQIICLVGPPGVGKTSIARSVARAMGRKYVRVSLGGVRDESDIRGHRKTYIGAMPGRIINAITLSGVSNPLVLLDEVDKLEGDFRGDPSSALLEVLDAEQNYAFRDHFVELPFDLSNVMFLTTANTLDTIPDPLLDRMEVISLSSYTREEKFNIAKKYLLSKQLAKHGLNKKTLKIDYSVLYDLIDYYTREAGVRSLEREIASLCRKAAKQLADGSKTAVHFTSADLEVLIGPRKYKPESISKADEVGVVTGLAWTSVGGETMPVEVCVLEGTGKLELTGSLGDVMKESAKAAISYIRSRSGELGIDGEFYQNKDIHIHVPEGAIPKDGPSAGVTMATAVASALMGLPVRREVAMTGEITLRGRVLPIGGLREKTMAAYRAGVKTIIIPEDNNADLAEVDKVVKDNVHFVTAQNMDKVLKTAIVFPDGEIDIKTEKPTPAGMLKKQNIPVIRQ